MIRYHDNSLLLGYTRLANSFISYDSTHGKRLSWQTSPLSQIVRLSFPKLVTITVFL